MKLTYDLSDKDRALLSPAERRRIRLDEQAARLAANELTASAARKLWMAVSPITTDYRGIPAEAWNDLGCGGIDDLTWKRAGLDEGELEVTPTPRGQFLFIPYIGTDELPFGWTMRAVDGRKIHIQPRAFAPPFPYGGQVGPRLATDEGRTLFVVESEIDAISVIVNGFHAVGFRGAPSPKSTPAGFFMSWRKVPRVVVLCDGDDAGRNTFADAVLARCVTVLGYEWTQERLDIISMDPGTDANTYQQAGRLRPLLQELEAS